MIRSDTIWHLFTVIGFPPGGSGRLTSTKIGKTEHKFSKMASGFYFVFAKEIIRRRFLISNVSRCKILPSTCGWSGSVSGKLLDSV